MLRDLLIRSCNVNLADREVHASTVAYTLCQPNELDRNTDSERLLVVNLIEVYVKQSVCYRVELQLLHYSGMRLAINEQVDNIDVGSVDNLAELSHRNCE